MDRRIVVFVAFALAISALIIASLLLPRSAHAQANPPPKEVACECCGTDRTIGGPGGVASLTGGAKGVFISARKLSICATVENRGASDLDVGIYESVPATGMGAIGRLAASTRLSAGQSGAVCADGQGVFVTCAGECSYCWRVDRAD